MADVPLPSLLPKVRRARGYRLYGEDGRRYLDLWQGGGRA
jgi:4-aminobutyrate aminotransferase-like enzyme